MSALLACRHCQARTNSAPNVARAAGWRTFEGPSQTGKPLSDAVCPSCAGQVPPAEVLRAASFDIECVVCDWTYSDVELEEDFEPLLTEEEAKKVARDHECEPVFRIKPPHGEWSERKDRWML